MVAALVLLGFLAVALGAVAYSYLAAKKRRDEMRAFATSRGWLYAEDEPRLVNRFTGPPFGLGSSPRAYNVIFGKRDGRDLVSFDYEYKTQTHSGNRTRTTVHSFSVLGLSMGVEMPRLSVDPENLLDRFVGRLSGSDIDLESEEFNRAFTVSCPDRKFASDVLNPQMMEFLLQYRHLGWRFEQDSMLVVAEGQRALDMIDPTLAVMDGITSRVPEFVWLRLKGLG